MDRNDVPSTTERGQDWDTPQECKCLYLSTVCKKDTTEHHHLYTNITVKKLHRMTIENFLQRLRQIDALATNLPCLKDDPDCLPEIEQMNVCLTPVMMCNLLVHSISPATEDEHNCMIDLMPTDTKKLAKQLTKVGKKLKEVMSEIKPEDRQNGKGHLNKIRSNKNAI